MKSTIAAFIADESGATAIEYSLLAALIGVAMITAASTLGTNVSNTFNKVSGNIK